MSLYSDLPYDEAGGHGGRRSQTQMVVIHATFNTASDENEAHYAEHRSDQVSAHFYNDADSVIQALDTDLVAYGCYPIGNGRSVQFELTGLDWDHAGGAPGDVSYATMREVAPVVARVCRQYGIPMRKVGPAELRAGARGICGHGDVTVAWGQGDHMDPGSAFPWSTFLSYLDPPPASKSGDDMPNGEIGTGFGIAETNDWIDQTRAVAVPLPAVGSGAGQWGDAWLYLAGAGSATLRYGCFPSGHWADASVSLTSAVGPLALPAGTTELLIARKRTAADDAADSAPVRWHVQYAA